MSGWLGTAMEFMDFQLYSLAAAIVFNKIFFPDVSPAVGLIAAMATYGVGYVARLAGAVYFGRMGDRIGRKKVLFLTITLMGASTTLIGVLPTVPGHRHPRADPAGGVAAGPGVRRRRGDRGRDGHARRVRAGAPPWARRLAGLARHNSGTLAASGLWALLVAVLSEDQLLSWGWRLPFLLSFVLMIFAVWMRRNLKESPVFEERADVVDGVALSGAEGRQSVLEAGARQRKGKAFFLALGLRFGQAGNSGLVQTFLVGYIATTLRWRSRCRPSAIMYGSIARVRHRAAGRHARRPVRAAAPVHRVERAHDRARVPAAAHDHQRLDPALTARHDRSR